MPASLVRAGRHFDGWFPIAPSAPDFAGGLKTVRQVATDNGRDPASIAGAMYLTISLDDDRAVAEARLNRFLEAYYAVPAEQTRRRQAHYCGPVEGLKPWLDAYVAAGASHLILRFAGDHNRHIALIATLLDRGL
jgi:alkanesulfonate monooxygenase SsuD/methylene tetrahydromethanopterin reductase-like flavin-dependent oxidoreductase (luciferase family)